MTTSNAGIMSLLRFTVNYFSAAPKMLGDDHGNTFEDIED